MEFDKSRIYTAFNANDLAIGSVCVFGFTVADLENWDTVSEVSEILPKNLACRFGAKDGIEYPFAYQICPPENAAAFYAVKAGKAIEIFDEKENVWRATFSPSEADFFKFRFQVARQCRAYKDTKELIADWKAKIGWKARTSAIENLTLPIIWIRNQKTKACYSVQAFNDTSVTSFFKIYSMKDLLDNFEFLDGSPCGVEVA